MHPRVQKLLADLDTQRAVLRAAVDAVPPELRQRRPAADRWSVAENLEHLAIVEQRIASVLAAHLETARARGLGIDRETDPSASTFDTSRLVDRTRRFKTGEASEPKAGLDADAAWVMVERSRAAVRDLLRAHDGLALQEIVHPHPFFGPLSMYDWMAFLAAHDARHAAQVREIIG